MWSPLLPLLIATFSFQCQGRVIVKVESEEVTAILNEMAANDDHAATSGEIEMDFQAMADPANPSKDSAPNKLFETVSGKLLGEQTFKTFKTLQDLYVLPDVNVADPNSDARTAAAKSFINSIMETKVMRAAWRFLGYDGFMSLDEETFKQQLFDFWFTPFSRTSSGVLGSSSFETVFVGEKKDKEVIGMNYWVRYFFLEDSANVNYHGYIFYIRNIITNIQFDWGTTTASSTSFLVGTSPEFDFCAYTVCAFAGIKECEYKHSGEKIGLSVNTFPTSSGNFMIDGVSSHVVGAVPSEMPTFPPIKNLQMLIDQMWAADVDRPTDYKLDWQKPVSGTSDPSPNPLFKFENEQIFDKPQYAALIEMYNKNLFVENVCKAEAEMSGFRKQYLLKVFDAFTTTTVFQLAYQYLQHIGVAGDWTAFRQQVWVLWMGTYSRCSGTLGSSGFEHVFLGELKGSTVDGQHSWVRYYLLEKAGKINYHGYISFDEQLTGTFQYTWTSALKKVGGFNIGTSPAFDFSIFTVCSLSATGNRGCRFNLAGFPMGVTSYTQACNEGTCLSTSYPTND